jgi:uncharacterized OB-fold protein
MTEYTKPIPDKTSENAPFFEGSLQGKLRLQRSISTETYRFPYAPFDPVDLSTDAEWVDVSGRATLWSWIVFHQVYFPSFKDDVPYPVIFVQLEEGPFMMATIPRDVRVEDLRIDMPMRVEFEPATEEFALAKFRPINS